MEIKQKIKIFLCWVIFLMAIPLYFMIAYVESFKEVWKEIASINPTLYQDNLVMQWLEKHFPRHPGKHKWICRHCYCNGLIISGAEVTADGRHDKKQGGCGEKVTVYVKN